MAVPSNDMLSSDRKALPLAELINLSCGMVTTAKLNSSPLFQRAGTGLLSISVALTWPSPRLSLPITIFVASWAFVQYTALSGDN